MKRHLVPIRARSTWTRSVLVLVLPWLVSCAAESDLNGGVAWDPESRPYLAQAVEVGRWLTLASHPEGGWPVAVETPGDYSHGVSSGTAGVVLFFIELHRATRDATYLQVIRAGADRLIASIPDSLREEDLSGRDPGNSLYGGWAGVGFVLDRAHETLGEMKYQDGARSCVDLLLRSATSDGEYSYWNPSNDILRGGAGTGLFLLQAAKRFDHEPSRELAVRVGDELLRRARPESTGVTWTMSEGNPNILPNFSHGAAGVGFFLATLHGVTGEPRFLDGALAAAEYLKSIARTDGETVFLVPYGWPNPSWEGLYDIGWAHGPAGTARLFHQLAYLTGDPQWTELVDKCGAGIRASGLPEDPAPGFGEPPFKRDRRFGTASAAEFFLRLYQDSGDEENLSLARALVDDIGSRAMVDEAGMRWTRPAYAFMERAGEPTTYTGYFYGAAGFGLLFLQLDAELSGLEWNLALPDDPFGLVSEF